MDPDLSFATLHSYGLASITKTHIKGSVGPPAAVPLEPTQQRLRECRMASNKVAEYAKKMREKRLEEVRSATRVAVAKKKRL